MLGDEQRTQALGGGELAVERVEAVEQRLRAAPADAPAQHGEALLPDFGHHLAEQQLAGPEPAVHRRPREAELARDRLHVDPFAGQEAGARERERVLPGSGRGTAGAAAGDGRALLPSLHEA